VAPTNPIPVRQVFANSAWDIVALVSLTLTGLACHWSWAQMNRPPIVFLSVVFVTVALVAWVWWLWDQLALWLTKFFCVAAIFDLLAEGLLQPFHGHTAREKLICQLTLFAAYALYLALLRPVDVWLAARRAE
jgi:hypothetical protein